MAKSHQKLDYRRLADSLVDRGLVDPAAMTSLLKQTLTATGATPYPMTEVLVGEGLVSDWELSRVVCELYNLPFLTVEAYEPSGAVLEGLDGDFFGRHCLVPLDVFGQILTIAMPGMVPSETIDQLERLTGAQILPVVGSVLSNRRWLQENLRHVPAGAAETAMGTELTATGGDAEFGQSPEDWGALFDQADAAVLEDLADRDEG